MTGFTSRDCVALAELLRDAARAEILPRFRRLDAAAVRTKTGPLDVVTEADEAAERVIAEGLSRRYPGCVVVGEEGCAAEPALLGRLAGAELAFVVDPVDGTSNFVAGLPLFGTMLAAIRHGEIVAAVIHDPIGDDTAIALRGEGAWMEARDGTRLDLRVAEPAPPAAMTGAASWRFMQEPLRSTVLRNFAAVGAVWDYRCAAHEYRMIAGGHCHFLLFNRIMPWDHAPGWLLHREAGGYAARLDGSAYQPKESTGGLLCAPDEASWHALRETFLRGLPDAD